MSNINQNEIHRKTLLLCTIETPCVGQSGGNTTTRKSSSKDSLKDILPKASLKNMSYDNHLLIIIYY